MDEKYMKYGFAAFILLIITIGILFVFSNKPEKEKINPEEIPKPEEIKEINVPEEINTNTSTEQTHINNTQTNKTEENNSKNTVTNNQATSEEINISPKDLPEPEIIPELEPNINISNINVSETPSEIIPEENTTIEIINLPSEI